MRASVRPVVVHRAVWPLTDVICIHLNLHCCCLLLLEREKESEKGCSRDGSHLSAQKTILDENSGRARRFFLYLRATFPFDILKAISSGMHTIAMHNRTWNASFLTFCRDKWQHLHDGMARPDWEAEARICVKAQAWMLRKSGWWERISTEPKPELGEIHSILVLIVLNFRETLNSDPAHLLWKLNYLLFQLN